MDRIIPKNLHNSLKTSIFAEKNRAKDEADVVIPDIALPSL